MNVLFNKLIRSDKLFTGPVIISFFSILLITGFLFYFYDQLPARLPLLYSLPWGEQQLVNKQQFFILPSVVALISLTNIFFALQLKSDQQVLKKILIGSLFLINLISLTTAFKIFFIFI